MKRIILCLTFLAPAICMGQMADSSTNNKAQQVYLLNSNNTRIYPKPKVFDFITKIPKNFLASNQEFVRGENPYYLTAASFSTLALIPFDQNITDGTRNFAQAIGMSEDNKYIKVAGLFKVPSNVGAGLYLIGNGSTSIMLALGFGTYGILKNDYRAQATASGLMESLILSGVFTQTIKRITGRESPFIAKKNGNTGGKWQPFPSFSEYAKHTPQYDAFPSGHLTTVLSALTVITENYPEIKWIKPVGYSAIGLMCFQMVQSEVHWVSDYPIAIFMGYLIGKSIAKSRFNEANKQSGNNKLPKLDIIASQAAGYPSIGLRLKL